MRQVDRLDCMLESSIHLGQSIPGVRKQRMVHWVRQTSQSDHGDWQMRSVIIVTSKPQT